MGNTAWRIVTIDQACNLSYSSGRLEIETAEGSKETLPLFDIRTIVIASQQVRLTAYLINELRLRQVGLIFCDCKKMPASELVGYYDHHATSLHMREQLCWKKPIRKKVWEGIVRQKMIMQRDLLITLQVETDLAKWERYLGNVKAGDRSNREGQAARLYFNALFGKTFHRRQPTNINAALNYGYAIVCSSITRSLTAHGYHPSLGIAHRGGTNPLNFTYDLIEPFRPFVDKIVYLHKDRELDRDYKRELVSVTRTPMIYGKKQCVLEAAVEQYVLDVAKSLTTENGKLKETGYLP